MLTLDKIIDVERNGDCLFQSIAVAEAWGDNQALPSTSERRSRAQALRLLANDFLFPGGCFSSSIMECLPLALIIEPQGDEDVSGYCKRLRKSGEWGTAAEILALSIVLGRSISVHRRSPHKVSIELMATYGENSKGTELRVLFVEESHYMAVVSLPTPVDIHQLASDADINLEPLHDSQSQDDIQATTSPASSTPPSDVSSNTFFNEIDNEPPGLHNNACPNSDEVNNAAQRLKCAATTEVRPARSEVRLILTFTHFT